MIGAVFQALLSHWRRHPGQALTLVAGLALATALWTAVQAINAEARASYATASALLAPDRAGTLTAPSGTIALDDYVALRRAGWQGQRGARRSPVDLQCHADLDGHRSVDVPFPAAGRL